MAPSALATDVGSPRIELHSVCVSHGHDGRDVIVGTHEHHDVGLAAGAQPKAVADIEIAALAQAAIERRIAA